jgi:thioesterase domain-containing protein
MSQRFVAPRDVDELQLSKLWAGILNKDSIGMKDNFFALGGDQRLAESVLSTIAAKSSAELPLEAFLAEPTIERLACALRAQARSRNEAPVVALQPNGSKRPFFFLPGGEGNVLNYYPLARRLAPDQPFYGLPSKGLYGDHRPYTRVEDMAAYHIECVRAVQPRGPYLLGGHCSGSIVALEMALQLQRCGERVAMIAACDAWGPSVFRVRAKNEPFLQDLTIFYAILAAGFRCWYGAEIGYKRAAFLDMEPARRAAYFMELARRHDVFPPDTTDERVDRVFELYRSVACSEYVPWGVYRGPITFLRARESDFCETLTEGWEEASTQELRVRLIPGNHVTLLAEPNVEFLANELRAAIAEADVS